MSGLQFILPSCRKLLNRWVHLCLRSVSFYRTGVFTNRSLSAKHDVLRVSQTNSIQATWLMTYLPGFLSNLSRSYFGGVLS